MLVFIGASLFAQSDDDLFGGSDDDFFADDGIDIVDEVTAKSDLSKGTLFENGSIKIGGMFNASLGTTTVLYADDDASFGDHVKDTTLTPTLNAFLSVDARPTETLRMYTKFGLAYPFNTTANSYLKVDYNPLTEVTNFSNGNTQYILDANLPPIAVQKVETSITDWFKLKELFTDFSIADRAFFRFGVHTVTWGTGYFFSPVSDMINASSINPEDTDAQVDGVLNLRTQITFPGSQNCLWLYVVPSTDFKNAGSAESYAKQTALAAKGDFVIGGWEFGVGGYWKYQNAPKAMITASGSLKKFSLFGEFVYQYGGALEWAQNTDWDNKKSIIQATAGVSYYFKDPMITLAAQYYYDGNDKDLQQYFTYGHNLAFLVNFGKILGTEDLSANIFGMVNFGKEDMPDMIKTVLADYGISSYLNSATFSAMLNYSPIKDFKIGVGPYVTVSAWEDKPTVALKLSATLGGGKF